MPQEISRADFVGVGLNATDTLIQVPRFPELDSKMEILGQQEMSLGGQVATAAVALSRWGWKTRYVGKVGDDEAGRLHRAAFAREGVEAQLIEVPRCASQKAFILVDQSTGERTILWKRDQRLDLSPDEMPEEWIENARLVHLDAHPGGPAVVAARWARAAGAIVTTDLDNIYPGTKELLEHVDYEISSRAFPERLTGIADLRQALPEIVRTFGCRVAGATLGKDGVLAWDGEAFHLCRGFCVSVVDTTGAGDIFHAGLAHALLKGQPLDYALEFGCAAAALNCTALGARGGIQPVSEIEQLMRTGARHQPLYTAEELSRHISSKT